MTSSTKTHKLLTLVWKGIKSSPRGKAYFHSITHSRTFSLIFVLAKCWDSGDHVLGDLHDKKYSFIGSHFEIMVCKNTHWTSVTKTFVYGLSVAAILNFLYHMCNVCCSLQNILKCSTFSLQQMQLVNNPCYSEWSINRLKHSPITPRTTIDDNSCEGAIVSLLSVLSWSVRQY